MEDLHFEIFAMRVLELHIIAGVLAEEDGVADFEEFRGIRAFFANASLPERDDDSLLRLLTGSSIGDDDAGGCHLLLFERVDDDAVTERLDGYSQAWNLFCRTVCNCGCHRMKGVKGKEKPRNGIPDMKLADESIEC